MKKGTGIPPTGRHLYDIGSVAKVFVTTLLAHAVVKNRISLEDDIRKYLPGKYPNLHYKRISRAGAAPRGSYIRLT